MALRRRPIGKDGEMRRRFFQSGELEPRIDAGAVALPARRAPARCKWRNSRGWRRAASGSSTMTKRHGWLNPTEGARQASSISVSKAPFGSGRAGSAGRRGARPEAHASVRGRRDRNSTGRGAGAALSAGLQSGRARSSQSKPSGCRETRPSQSASAASPARLPAAERAASRHDRRNRASKCRRVRDDETARRRRVCVSRNSVVPPTICRPAPLKIASSRAAAVASPRRESSIQSASASATVPTASAGPETAQGPSKPR